MSKIRSSFRKLNEDVRAEALFYFGGKYPARDEPLFFANGGFKRIFRKDVAALHKDEFKRFRLSRTVIEMHRKGLYDRFPENFFHQSKSQKHFKSIKNLKEEHEHHKLIEENTRKFFWPFDDQLTRMKASLISFELQMGQIGKSGDDYLRRFWNVPSIFDARQTELLVQLLPLASEISGRLDWLEEVMSGVLSMPLKITKRLRSFQNQHTSSNITLGKSKLGFDSVLGPSFYKMKYHLRFLFGPLEPTQANAMAAGESTRAQFDYLCNHLIPLDLTYQLEFLPSPGFSTTLGPAYEDCSTLGVSSFINQTT